MRIALLKIHANKELKLNPDHNHYATKKYKKANFSSDESFSLIASTRSKGLITIFLEEDLLSCLKS